MHFSLDYVGKLVLIRANVNRYIGTKAVFPLYWSKRVMSRNTLTYFVFPLGGWNLTEETSC